MERARRRRQNRYPTTKPAIVRRIPTAPSAVASEPCGSDDGGVGGKAGSSTVSFHSSSVPRASVTTTRSARSPPCWAANVQLTTPSPVMLRLQTSPSLALMPSANGESPPERERFRRNVPGLEGSAAPTERFPPNGATASSEIGVTAYPPAASTTVTDSVVQPSHANDPDQSNSPTESSRPVGSVSFTGVDPGETAQRNGGTPAVTALASARSTPQAVAVRVAATESFNPGSTSRRVVVFDVTDPSASISRATTSSVPASTGASGRSTRPSAAMTRSPWSVE